MRQNQIERRFYINQGYGGCPADAGYFAVFESPDVCGYNSPPNRYPLFGFTVNVNGGPDLTARVNYSIQAMRIWIEFS